MTTVSQRLTTRRKSNLRGSSQINDEVLLLRFNEAYTKLQKQLLEYVANQFQTLTVTQDIEEGVQEYVIPGQDLTAGIDGDFYSIAQLRVAFKEKNGIPCYRVCEPISVTDYNIRPDTGRQVGAPYVFGRISKLKPRYYFTGKNKIKIFPKPKEDVEDGLNMTFNYIRRDIVASTDIDSLGIPRYFWDALDEYLQYKLIQKENPEIA